VISRRALVAGGVGVVGAGVLTGCAGGVGRSQSAAVGAGTAQAFPAASRKPAGVLAGEFLDGSGSTRRASGAGRGGELLGLMVRAVPQGGARP